jgi:uncharacterized tellurite resistance protein B-like protein
MASKRERSLALLKVLAAAAWADGRLDHEEINHMKELMLVYDLGSEEMSEIDLLLERPVSYARCEDLTRDLLGMLDTQAEREEVLNEVKAILGADGQFTDEERDVLAGLQGIMNAMTSVDRFMNKITSVFKRTFVSRERSGVPGELSEYLKNAVLQRLHDLSGGEWKSEIDARTLNRYTLFGAVLGRVADAEDGVSDEELAKVRELLKARFLIEPPLLDWVAQAVREASAAHMDRQGLLSEFNRISDSTERKELLDAAFAVAAADGEVGKGELEELRLISNFLWIDPRAFNDIRLRWVRKES